VSFERRVAPLVCVWAHLSHAGGLPEIDDAVRASSTVVVLASASVNGYKGRRGRDVLFVYDPTDTSSPPGVPENAAALKMKSRMKTVVCIYVYVYLCIYTKSVGFVRVVRIHPPLTRSGRC
jgi:hypothetical protein